MRNPPLFHPFSKPPIPTVFFNCATQGRKGSRDARKNITQRRKGAKNPRNNCIMQRRKGFDVVFIILIMVNHRLWRCDSHRLCHYGIRQT
jgi:hypothetical protein